jgi:hypothetical protein
MFDPQAHLMQLPRRALDRRTGAYRTVYEDDLEVKWRLVWFRDKYPNGTIVTEVLCIDLDRECRKTTEQKTKTARGYTRFRATVSTGEGGTATGTGTETAVIFPDFVEKAEPRAVGRALAVPGIGTQFVGEELSEGAHLCDALVLASTSADHQPGPGVAKIRPAPADGERQTAKLKDDSAALRETLIAAIGRALLFTTPDGQGRWKPGAKAHCARVFGTITWREVKAFPLERLRTGYVELRKLLDGVGASRVPAPVMPEAATAPAVATHHAPAAVTPAQEALKQEALG